MKITTKYEEICFELAEKFIEHFYDTDEEEFRYNIDWFFVADDPTGVVDVSDCFFNIEHCHQALKYGYTYDQLMDWYYDYLDEDKPNTCLRDYLKLKEAKKPLQTL